MRKLALLNIALLFLFSSCGEFEKGQARATVIDSRTIVKGIEDFRAKNGVLPKAESIQQLKSLLEPAYVPKMPVKDGWGNDFYYKSAGADYWLGSASKDGVFGGFDQREIFKGVYDKDVVFHNGVLVYGPAIKEHK